MNSNVPTTRLVVASTIAILAVATSFHFLRPTISAAPPEFLNYQGTLANSAGQPLAGPHTLQFNIYDGADPNASNLVWGPFTSEVEIAAGRFNAVLGPEDAATPDARSIKDAFAGDGDRFIEIKVDGGNAILPRQQFLSVPYAFDAAGMEALQDRIAALEAKVEANSGFHADVFETPGTHEWTVPPNVTRAYVKVIGAGGSGRRAGDPAPLSRAGGGGGGVAEKWLTGLVPGTTYEVIVGHGGNSNGNNRGDPGDPSSFGDSADLDFYCFASGGRGGGEVNPEQGGLSGMGAHGHLNYGLGDGFDQVAGVHGGGIGGGREGEDGKAYGAGAGSVRYDSKQGGHGLVLIVY